MSLVIKKMNIETTKNYFILVKLAFSKKTKDNKS